MSEILLMNYLLNCGQNDVPTNYRYSNPLSSVPKCLVGPILLKYSNIVDIIFYILLQLISQNTDDIS